MQTEQFLERVQRYGPRDGGAAEIATIATLQLLAQQMPAEEVRNMTPQLPKELAQPIDDVAGKGEPVTDVDAFYRQVSERTELALDETIEYVHAVTRVLHDAITDGELEEVKLVLPTELKGLVARA